MKFNALMHVSFYTAKYDEMTDFYVNKLGFPIVRENGLPIEIHE